MISASELSHFDVVFQERVNEFVLLRHLHQVIALLTKPPDRGEDGELWVRDALVVLGP